ncbi:MAG: suppressor of fused domain protein [Saprospiraceae bacterium]
MDNSESGAPIIRHTNENRNEFAGPSGQPSIEEISAHIEEHVGEIEFVYHELVSDQVHIDVHYVKPTPERPFHTLVTSGMSDKPMATPDDAQDLEYAELTISLPEEWKVSEEDFKDEENFWPIRWLKLLARFPHEYNTWLSMGHTIPNGDPAVPFAPSTKLNTMLLLPSVIFGEEFHALELNDKTINFFTLVPLYTEEVNLKMKKGVEALFDGFDKHGVNDILQLNRINTAKRKKFLGLF